MIGVEFERTNEYNNFLTLLFYNTDLSFYNFVFAEKEIYEIDNFDYELAGEEFSKIIDRNQKCYIVFLNLRVFKKDKKIGEIKSYNDFINSDCELLVLIHDVTYVEIYFKDNELKNQILNNLDNLKIDYRIKTSDNDERYIMYVY